MDISHQNYVASQVRKSKIKRKGTQFSNQGHLFDPEGQIPLVDGGKLAPEQHALNNHHFDRIRAEHGWTRGGK